MSERDRRSASEFIINFNDSPRVQSKKSTFYSRPALKIALATTTTGDLSLFGSLARLGKQKIKNSIIKYDENVINKASRRFSILMERIFHFPINLLFSSSFSSAELAALEISGGVPTRPDDVLNSESPELQP